MNRSTPISLFTVDDHPVVRAGLRTVQELSEDIRIVGEAADAATALEAISRLRPEVVLLDVRLQNESGIEVCRQIKRASPTTRVLMLTSFVDEQLILSALEAGADGYLLKENDTQRLVHAIQEVHRGEAVFDSEVSRRLNRATTSGSHQPANRLADLSPQERRLLNEVAQGKTDKEAAVTLGLAPKTVRNYLDRIFTKLGVHTRTEAATTFIKSGGWAPESSKQE